MMENGLPFAAAAALRFEEKVLPNGLVVRLLPMPGYSAVHAIYATNFGSIHRAFEQGGQSAMLPAGIAHFLEHKMFENEDGVDAFSLYAKTGASANAYTSFDRTSYIFTATGEIERNLDILLSFVGHPHFTEATVKKEQGIIGQEIKMYDDYPEVRCYFALFECLYHNHPVRDDIVGTVESIATITPDMLYRCCNAFYNPTNMGLFAAGNVTMDELLAAVERAGLPAEKAPPTKRVFPEEPRSVAKRKKEIAMPVAMPMFGFGFKEMPLTGNTTKGEVVCDMLTELLAGETSALYRRLYDEGLVQPGFSGEYNSFEGALSLLFTGEGADPARVKQELFGEIERQRREGVDAAQFETCKRMMYGEAIAGLENVERVASALSGCYFHGRTPAEELEAVASLTLDEVNEALQTMLLEENSAEVVINPAT